MNATARSINVLSLPVKNRPGMQPLYFGEKTFFETLVLNAPDLMYTVDHSGMFSFVNERSIELTEFSREELLNMHYLELVDPDYIHVVKKHYVHQAFRGPEITYFEFPIITKSGKRVWIGQKVVVHHHHTTLGFEAIARDISDKKEAEEKLHNIQQEYKNMFEHAVQGMFQSSVDGTIISANPALLRLLGYKNIEELRHLNLSELYVDHEDRERLSLLLATKGRCRNIELKLKRKDGRVITVLEHSRSVTDGNGNIVMYEGIIEDITAKKAIEEQVQHYLSALKASEKALRELHAQKNKMCSIIAHDLRSPFTSILGFCDLLLEEQETLSPEEHREYLTYIRDSARSQLKLVNDLLDFTRLDSGQARMEKKPCDLHEIAYNAVIALLGVAKQKGIALASTIPQQTMVKGDERWLQQAFTNLIGNALKFTPENGKVQVTVNEITNENIIIDISDTGVGIPESAIPKLFKIEEKYSTIGTKGEKGSGIGLPVCHEIMVKHGGAISVESSTGKGTTFHLTFPRLCPERQQTILIVDDELGVRKLHARHIQKNFPSCNVLQAENGAEGLRLAENTLPQLIITDYAMPTMNGFELIQAIKQNVKTCEIPVLVITGNGSDANRESFLLSGARAVITKPIIASEFQEVVKRILEE
ncbi:MAG: PAS domain S-box protein [Bacteroidetes bacterium]|nr:MAG: PAS domain S-box protein [Bacteroidota bacterium]